MTERAGTGGEPVQANLPMVVPPPTRFRTIRKRLVDLPAGTRVRPFGKGGGRWVRWSVPRLPPRPERSAGVWRLRI